MVGGYELLQLQMREHALRPCSEIMGAEVQASQCLDLPALLLPQLQGLSNICPHQAAERHGACLQL